MAAKPKLYTLTEVSRRTGISMPTLQRYKKLYQSRIPSVGEGRKQRYPKEVFRVVEQIKKENLGKRGRPRKAAAAKSAAPKRRVARKPAKKAVRKAKSARKARAPKASAGAGLLSLVEVSKRTKISYPTLLRYVKANLKDLPHEGVGRKRRYYPEAVEVFNMLRGQSKRGRRKGSAKKAVVRKKAPAKASSASNEALLRRLLGLEKSHAGIAKRLEEVLAHLKKPLKLTVGR